MCVWVRVYQSRRLTIRSLPLRPSRSLCLSWSSLCSFSLPGPGMCEEMREKEKTKQNNTTLFQTPSARDLDRTSSSSPLSLLTSMPTSLPISSYPISSSPGLRSSSRIKNCISSSRKRSFKSANTFSNLDDDRNPRLSRSLLRNSFITSGKLPLRPRNPTSSLSRISRIMRSLLLSSLSRLSRRESACKYKQKE